MNNSTKAWIAEGLEGANLRSTLKLYICGAALLSPVIVVISLLGGEHLAAIATPPLVIALAIAEYRFVSAPAPHIEPAVSTEVPTSSEFKAKLVDLRAQYQQRLRRNQRQLRQVAEIRVRSVKHLAKFQHYGMADQAQRATQLIQELADIAVELREGISSCEQHLVEIDQMFKDVATLKNLELKRDALMLLSQEMTRINAIGQHFESLQRTFISIDRDGKKLAYSP